MAKPISGRIIPAGAPLPPHPPGATDIPPWRTPPPAPPVHPQAPIEIVHRYVHEIVLVPAEPEPEPTRWDRAWAWLRGLGRPWQLAAALGLSVAPILPGGYSAATTWFYVVHQTRADHGAVWGYALAAGTLTASSTLLARRPGVVRLWLLAVAFVGGLGTVALIDPITALTGVTR